LRPDGQKDAVGVNQAHDQMRIAREMIEGEMASKEWAMGDAFTMADCAAAPALFYANKVMPLAGDFKNTAAHLQRLSQRVSFARVLKEAEPYMAMFPSEERK
jgi:glutathione S-transferase